MRFTSAITSSAFVLFLLINGSLSLYWQSDEYWGTPVGETAVGTIIFDPGIGTQNAQCIDTVGAVFIKLISCPLIDASFFATSGTKITLAAKYYLSRNGHSQVVTGCVLSCQDSTNATDFSTLNVIFINSANMAPVWNFTFPTIINLASVEANTIVVDTPAYDIDVDKTANGRLTYFVFSIDNQAVVGGISQLLRYDYSGNSSVLRIFRTLPWRVGSYHNVVIAVRDNPANQAIQNVIVKNLTLIVSASLPSTVSWLLGNYSTTTPMSTGFTVESSGLTYLNFSDFPWLYATTTYSSAACAGINIIVCGNNWIWLAVGGACLLAIIIVIIVAVVCWRRYGNGNYKRHHRHRRHHRHYEDQQVYPNDYGDGSYRGSNDPRYIDYNTRY